MAINLDDLTPEEEARLEAFVDAIHRDANFGHRLKDCTDAELADLLVVDVWADMQLGSFEAALVSTAAERLRGE